MAIVGIDLGTSNSLAAVWQNDGVQLIPNSMGNVLTPSAVSVMENGSLLVGEGARERCISHPDTAVTGFKRHMGTNKSFRLGAKTYSAEDLSSLVLRKLRQDAEAFLNEPVTQAVISVPAYFTDNQRAATKRAGQLAGLTVNRLINEPSAAALTCRLYNSDKDFTALVFDFGGGTLDVSIVDCFDTMLNVLAVAGDNHLGGRDFDQDIAEAYCTANNLLFDALRDGERAILLQRAELVKQQLSTRDSATLRIDDGPLAGELALTQQRLIDLCAPIFQRMSLPVRRALADSDMRMDDINRVVLVGGSCHMPVVRLYLQQILQREIDVPFSPDTVVGLGAGILAAVEDGTELMQKVVMTDVCPFTLGTSIKNDAAPDKPLFSPIIQRNSVLPCRRTDTYYTASDFQTQVLVDVYQGEQMYAKDNLYLGELSIAVPPRPKGEETVDISFTYDINGILVVDVKVNSSGEHIQRLLTGKGQLTEAQVQHRLRELATLTLTPQDDERCRNLCAKAESLYAQSTGNLRETISLFSRKMQAAMRTGGSAKLERLLPQWQEMLAALERQITGLGTLPMDADILAADWDDADEEYAVDEEYADDTPPTATEQDNTSGDNATTATEYGGENHADSAADGALRGDSQQAREATPAAGSTPPSAVAADSAAAHHGSTDAERAESSAPRASLLDAPVVKRKQ